MQKIGKKAAVAVAEDERAVARANAVEVSRSAAMEQTAERHPFERLIWCGEPVERRARGHEITDTTKETRVPRRAHSRGPTLAAFLHQFHQFGRVAHHVVRRAGEQ